MRSTSGRVSPVVCDSRGLAVYSRMGHAPDAGMNRNTAGQRPHNHTCDTLHAGVAMRCGRVLYSESTGHRFIEMKCLQTLINRMIGLRISARCPMLKGAFIVLALSLALCSNALADSLTLSGTLVNSGSFAGTVSFNSAAGVFTGADFNAVEGPTAYLFDPSPTSQYSPEGRVYLGELLDGLGDIFYLDIPGSNLIGYAGGLAMMSIPDAPEPPSLLLTATGVLGILAAVWRRRRYARLDPAACA